MDKFLLNLQIEHLIEIEQRQNYLYKKDISRESYDTTRLQESKALGDLTNLGATKWCSMLCDTASN
jgi:hypothetical protein